MIKKQILILFILIFILSTITYAWSTNKQIFTSTIKQTINKQIGLTPTKVYTTVNNYPFLNNEISKSKVGLIQEPPRISFNTCFETDNGADYFHQGTTYFLPNPTIHCQNEVAGAMEQCRIMRIGNCLQYIPAECRPRAQADYCRNATILSENYCSFGNINMREHRCEYGCYNGACL